MNLDYKKMPESPCGTSALKGFYKTLPNLKTLKLKIKGFSFKAFKFGR